MSFAHRRSWSIHLAADRMHARLKTHVRITERSLMNQEENGCKNQLSSREINRRDFLGKTAAVTGSAIAATLVTDSLLANSPSISASAASPTRLAFTRPDSMFHGHDWQTLNPGYWKIENGSLRRRLTNYGDRARRTGFPYHEPYLQRNRVCYMKGPGSRFFYMNSSPSDCNRKIS